MLEIGDLPEGGVILSLFGHDWHSHGDLLQESSGGKTDEEAVVLFLRAIFGGSYLLAEVRKNGRCVRKEIEDDRNALVEGLEPGEELIIWESSVEASSAQRRGNVARRNV